MWEAIRSNYRRSWILIILMGILLVALGGAVGMTVDPRPQAGGATGGAIAALLWLVLWMVAILGGDGVLLAGSGAVEIKKEDAPQLWNIVEEMTIASGLAKMPRILVIDRAAPNAFAVGRRPDSASVVVTSGLLRSLSRDQLQGVIGHEIGHIRNLDIRYMVMVGVMLGAIVMIADVFLRTVGMFGAGPRRSSRDGGGGGAAQAILLVAALVLAILAPLLAQILYFACSRRREFLADASSARFTRYPEGLASALEKISASAPSMADVSRVLAPMYTVNPREPRGVMGLFSTHPPTDVRIHVLRSMAGRAGLVDYEAAYRQVTGRGCMGKQTLASEGTVAARTPSAEPAPTDHPVARAQATSDLFRRLANFLVIPCECGVRIKVPPGYEGSTITCARCGRVHALPAALPAVAAGMAGLSAGLPAAAPPAATEGSAGDSAPAAAPPPTLHYQRRGTGGWESFRCQCGRTLQIGPGFHAPHLDCPWCHARIEIT